MTQAYGLAMGWIALAVAAAAPAAPAAAGGPQEAWHGASSAARLGDVARIIEHGLRQVDQEPEPAALVAAAAMPDDPGVPAPPNLFPAFGWAPPPAPIPPPLQASPAPRARPDPPPMPFQVAAMWRYQGQQPVIAMQAFGNTYLLCERCGVPGHYGVGTVLERAYRIERIAQTGVTLTYLPMRHVSVVRMLPPAEE